MSQLIDNSEIERIMAKLETLEDEVLAVELLREFNDKTRHLGLLIMNRDENLTHEDWKRDCDLARQEVEQLIARIESL